MSKYGCVKSIVLFVPVSINQHQIQNTIVEEKAYLKYYTPLNKKKNTFQNITTLTLHDYSSYQPSIQYLYFTDKANIEPNFLTNKNFFHKIRIWTKSKMNTK